MSTTYDVIVIGGGAVGSTAAWRLAQSGRKVLLLEQTKLGSEASSAAAGMLGAQLEVAENGPFFQLCIQSRDMYDDFLRELYEESGIDAQLTRNGIVQVAFSQADVDQLQTRMQWQTAAGHRAFWWTKDQLAAKEPALAPALGGLLLPDDGNIMAPLLAQAAGVAAKRRATVMEGTEVISIDAHPDGVAVTSNRGTHYAQHVVVAAGAWAKKLLADVGVQFPVYPVKGQMCRIRPRSDAGLKHTVFANHFYLVPKRDGSIVVGATEEHDAGFNRDVTTTGIEQLLAAVRRIAPQLTDSAFEDSWIGLRPGSPTGLPAIGPLPGNPNVVLAAGHFRNGILLSPVTAQMIVDALDGAAWPKHWRPFLPTYELKESEAGTHSATQTGSTTQTPTAPTDSAFQAQPAKGVKLR
ncbi:glycine oxidase ThiO [Alicyclobacillus tolerans]|uniref:glycine oxidase ThiO n=1 Tax=Alicyclobacillus tolerans TaxID=90970 RepID=UPI001F0228CD|nr:glycine oxidase ThiO [Alicyclobacillus tolerans]MCF8564024.1 glycine oxidase ThiO [Alicyclobacillus tolerans]